MSTNGWKYYNHAIVPDCAPHEEPDTSVIEDGSIWKLFPNQKPLFIRYTTDFDCGYETDWWYCIKDGIVDLENMKNSKRYKINKGLRKFEVKKIDPNEYREELYQCYLKASARYKTYHVDTDQTAFLRNMTQSDNIEIYAAFAEDQSVAGYSINTIYDDYVSFTSGKFDPAYMNQGVSAALMYNIIHNYVECGTKKYVCDGERCISHKTNIQDYLEDLFGFRKAYCKLNIVYRKPIGIIVKMLYPFRKLLLKLDSIIIFSNINSILKMEEIVRNQKKD